MNDNRVIMGVENNRGYSPDQVDTSMTLADLLAGIQEAIEEFGEDAVIVTKDSGNFHGARFGSMDQWGDLFSAADPDEDGGF